MTLNDLYGLKKTPFIYNNWIGLKLKKRPDYSGRFFNVNQHIYITL